MGKTNIRVADWQIYLKKKLCFKPSVHESQRLMEYDVRLGV